jgi:hypothetical protein
MCVVAADEREGNAENAIQIEPQKHKEGKRGKRDLIFISSS